jgi:hypothetical protein
MLKRPGAPVGVVSSKKGKKKAKAQATEEEEEPEPKTTGKRKAPTKAKAGELAVFAQRVWFICFSVKAQIIIMQ